MTRWLLTVALLSLPVTGCGLIGALPTLNGGENPATPPAEAPSIRGTITAITTGGSGIGTIRVEENPNEQSGSAKASVTLKPETGIWLPDGRPGIFADLRSGQAVKVWFTGPVRESYPVQADASAVVIER